MTWPVVQGCCCVGIKTTCLKKHQKSRNSAVSLTAIDSMLGMPLLIPAKNSVALVQCHIGGKKQAKIQAISPSGSPHSTCACTSP